MNELGVPAGTALLELHQRLLKNPKELIALWEEMGDFFLDRAEKEIWSRGGPVAVGGRRKRPTVTPEAAADAEDETRKQSLRLGFNPLDVTFPIGRTGIRKRLGAWTRADVEAARDAYHDRGRRLLARGDEWGRIAEQMQDGETLEAMLARVPVEERDGFPASIARIAPASAEEEQAVA